MSATTPGSAPVKRVGVLINRTFAFLWLGQSVSQFGDQVFNTTLVIWIAVALIPDRVVSPLAVGGVLIAAALPVLFVSPLAGVFVDRWDKRRTMLTMDALRVVLIGALALTAGTATLTAFGVERLPLNIQLGATYVAVFLASCCAQFFNPARLAFIGAIVEDSAQARASGLSQVTTSLASILGPLLAVPLFFVFGVQWALLLNAASFAVSFLAILAVRAPKTAKPHEVDQRGAFGRELVEGLRFGFGNRIMMTLLVSMGLVVAGAGAFNTLIVFFLTENLRAPATQYGLIGGMEGAGALLGAIAASIFASRIGLTRLFSFAIFAAGILFVILARMTNLTSALAVVLLIGVMTAGLNVAIPPLILRVVPRHLVGRVFSLLTPVIVLASLLGVGLSGYLASSVLVGFHVEAFGVTFGPIDTILLGAGALILLGGVYALLNLREVKAAPTCDPAPVAVPSGEAAVVSD